MTINQKMSLRTILSKLLMVLNLLILVEIKLLKDC
jgi:hypothetical protein